LRTRREVRRPPWILRMMKSVGGNLLALRLLNECIVAVSASLGLVSSSCFGLVRGSEAFHSRICRHSGRHDRCHDRSFSSSGGSLEDRKWLVCDLAREVFWMSSSKLNSSVPANILVSDWRRFWTIFRIIAWAICRSRHVTMVELVGC
jgi:hypothetical protein